MENVKDNFLTLKELRGIIDNIDSSHDEDVVVISTIHGDYRPIYKGNVNSVSIDELYIPSDECIWYGSSKIRDEYMEQYKNDPFYGEGDDYKIFFCNDEEKQKAINCVAIYCDRPIVYLDEE